MGTRRPKKVSRAPKLRQLAGGRVRASERPRCRARGAGEQGCKLCVLMRGGVFCLKNLFTLQPFSSTCCMLGRVLGAVGVQVYLVCVS